MTLKIDKEFKELIPALSQDEYKLLEESLTKEGFNINRGKIITWNGIIVYGHNRYEICAKHNITYESEEKEFDDISDVKIWIIQNQLGRRNINDFVRAELALKFKDEIRTKARLNSIRSGEEFGKGLQKSAEPITPVDTRQEIAKIANVSHDTVHKVGKILDNAPKHIRDKARSGELKIHTAYKEMQRELSETKRCNACGEEKPLADFHVRQDRNKRDSRCKQCENERKRVQHQKGSFDETIKGFKSEIGKLGRYSFIMGGVSTLSSAIETVSDDLKKYLNEVTEKSERNHIKKQIQDQITELKNLLNLF